MVKHDLVYFETGPEWEEHIERQLCLACGKEAQWRIPRWMIESNSKVQEFNRKLLWRSWEDTPCPVPPEATVLRVWLERQREKYQEDRGPHPLYSPVATETVPPTG